MSGTQQLVGAAGIGLVAANLWTGKQRQQLAPLWAGSGDLAGAHTVAKQLGVELVAVAALTLVAGTGPSQAGACLAIVVALWLVWLMARHGSVSGIGHAAIAAAGRGQQHGAGTVAGTPPRFA